MTTRAGAGPERGLRGSRRRSAARGLAARPAVLLAFLVACSAPAPAPVRDAAPTSAPAVAVEQVPPAAAPTDPTLAADPRTQALTDLAAAAELAAQGVPSASAGAQPQVLGGDISWPQCPVGLGIPQRPTQGLPPPLPSARFVVIGLTNGPGFTPNPCLADQVSDARERGLLTAAYAVVSYPTPAQVETYGEAGPHDAGTAAGLLRNVGHAQAQATLADLETAGLATPVVWIDVESVADFDWSADPAANAAVVAGAAGAYRDAGYRIGVYSTPYLWQQIVGDLRLDAVEWRPAGPSSRAAAEARCGPDWSIQGGVAVLVQWVEGQRDLDVTCPGMPGTLADWFDPPSGG